MSSSITISQLLNTLPQSGTLQWIGLRDKRRGKILTPASAQLSESDGLVGDRYSGSSGKRHVTLVQHEHLAAIGSLLHVSTIDPADLRRNLIVSGINLLALKSKQFAVGKTLLEYTGLCHPCSRMEETFGDGGYNAVRGHGGITARVISAGAINIGDSVLAFFPDTIDASN